MYKIASPATTAKPIGTTDDKRLPKLLPECSAEIVVTARDKSLCRIAGPIVARYGRNSA